MKDITAKQLKSRLDAGEDIIVIDVREDWEVAQGKLDQAVHIPMDNIPDSIDQIPQDKPVVIMCHTGRRSEQVILWLEAEEDYENLHNLVGGINAWADEFNPSLKY
jgi:sulfur-carrier protein adenylyltransferase/sulfurtransferase